MDASFDQAASSYDNEFTNSNIGRMQRDHVWQYLSNHFTKTNQQLNVLELNCGTGEDAIWIGGQGHKVLATDISTKMLEESNKKVVIAGLEKKVQTKQLDLTKASDFQPNNKFDLVFSNFGGLNCLSFDELKTLSSSLKSWLKKDAKMVFVIMPKHTQLDSWYRLAKLQWTARKERRNGFTKVNLDGTSVDCYYHNVEEIGNAFQDFKVEEYKPVGFLPSYFESFSEKHPSLFKYLLKYEEKNLKDLGQVNKSDHYLIKLSHVA